ADLMGRMGFWWRGPATPGAGFRSDLSDPGRVAVDDGVGVEPAVAPREHRCPVPDEVVYLAAVHGHLHGAGAAGVDLPGFGRHGQLHRRCWVAGECPDPRFRLDVSTRQALNQRVAVAGLSVVLVIRAVDVLAYV